MPARLTYVSYHWLVGKFGANKPILLMVAALVFFFANTLPDLDRDRADRGEVEPEGLVGVLFLVVPVLPGGRGRGRAGWNREPVGGMGNIAAGVAVDLLGVPIVPALSGRLEAEKERVEVEKRHVEQIASLNMRTIEALALAIEAKDHTTHTHLQRVRTYAVAVAKQLNLPESEIEALRAAALLHDIGKLAVPEQIINKPGKLTPEEFEKMKVHPLVGAEILERVAFPYPVAPIVRSHHERWDGTGYPEGLSGRRDSDWRANSCRQWIAWTRWHRTGNTVLRCRWSRRWRK